MSTPGTEGIPPGDGNPGKICFANERLFIQFIRNINTERTVAKMRISIRD